MKKRIIATLMSIAIAASLCACGSGAAQQPQPEAGAAEEGSAGETDEEEPAGEVSEDAAQDMTAAYETVEEDTAAEGSDVRPEVTFNHFHQMEEKDLTVIASLSYEVPVLIENAVIEHTELHRTLVGDCEAIAERYRKSFDEIKEAAGTAIENMDGDVEDFPAGEIEGTMEVVRCDASVLSLCDISYVYYPGAAHGITGYTGYNYDTWSGNPITLEDVFADLPGMEAAIADNLIAVSTGEKVEAEDGMLDYAFENGYESLNWVIDRDGVRFIFSPSDIAPYALGTIEAKVSFSENPSLFTGTYGAAEGSYVKKLEPYMPYAVDLDGDGSAENVSVNSIAGDDDYYNAGLEVHVGDETLTQEDAFYGLTAYLLHTEDGRNYVYTFTSGDNDYPTLTVFAIRDKVPSVVGKMEGSGTASQYIEMLGDDGEADPEESFIQRIPLIDPAHFALSTRLTIMSTYSGVRYYGVGDDGMPVPQTDQYDVRNGIVLTSLVDLKAEEVDVLTNQVTGKEVDIPAGTKFTFYQTNGTDTVDLMTEDETLLRFNVSGEWPQTVNGVKLEEAFDGILFAG